MPWMTYDSAQLVESSLEFYASSNDDHFNDVYEIMTNNTSVVYSCPLGWVFDNSNNITHTAYCQDWAWFADFDPNMPCVRKF